jgi:hypothetical protein
MENSKWKMENWTIRLSEKIILRKPHPPPSPSFDRAQEDEERGPILQLEMFTFF